jgi:broad specificity phosphatase PhoE
LALFYLVRHGEADYSQLMENGFFGFGRDFASLSKNGIEQVEKIEKDQRLKSAQIIVSSPYTRALQTAAIISRETSLKICVEADLHEWIPDKTNQYKTSEEAFALAKEFYDNSGVYPNGQQLRWETLDEVRKRMQRVAEKYAGYKKVILVGHSMAFEALTDIEDMQPAEIIEWEN